MKLTTQALVQLMIALQKSLSEESDIVPILMNFNWEADLDGNLVVSNPITAFQLTGCEDISPPEEEEDSVEE